MSSPSQTTAPSSYDRTKGTPAAVEWLIFLGAGPEFLKREIQQVFDDWAFVRDEDAVRYQQEGHGQDPLNFAAIRIFDDTNKVSFHLETIDGLVHVYRVEALDEHVYGIRTDGQRQAERSVAAATEHRKGSGKGKAARRKQ